MDDSFQLLDLQAAQTFLAKFPAEAQKRGHARFQEGAVIALTSVKPGNSYSATVNETAWKNQVTLNYDPIRGWEGSCTCPARGTCMHVFAVMSAILAEHRTAVVRQLSTGQATSSIPLSVLKARPEPASADTFAEKLAAATGRPLCREAQRFLKQLHEIYLRCCQTRQINSWDLRQLGYQVHVPSWGPLNIWPALPRSEHEFWLYLAFFLNEQELEIPAFMKPVTDLALIAERVAQWRRSSEIERWKVTLDECRPERPRGFQIQQIDLRVRLDATTARLQWLRQGQRAFETLNQNQYRQLVADYDTGLVAFNQDAELVWQLFSNAVDFRIKLYLEDEAPALVRTLNRLFRSPSLESRIVNAKGEPFVRVPEPLRWEITPAQSDTDDYGVRLVQADGSAAPPITLTLEGHPTLFLTEYALYFGPALLKGVLDPQAENRIPAPAIEQSSGVAFLQSLGAEMPQRIRDRVRRVPLRVTIHCSLSPSYPGAASEDCFVNIQALADDGIFKVWNGFSWVEKKSGTGPKNARPDSTITVYETASMDEVPFLLEPLKLKPAQNRQGLSTRVTKKFPEVFAAWLRTVPNHITLKLEGELASLNSPEVAGRVKLEVTEQEIDWFDLQVVLDVADTTLSPAEIKLLLNAKGGYVRLEGKGWRRLQYDLTEDENERLARLGLSPRELSAEPQRLHALQLADEAAKKFLPEQQVEQIQRRASEIKARVAPPLPAGITAQLRPYQLEGFHFLAYLSTNRFGGILADDMGLGKTVQTLSWLIWLRQQTPLVNGPDGTPDSKNNPAPCLVVCPKSVMDNWHAEAARFAAELRIKTWPASEAAQFLQHLDTADVHVINYSQLRLLGESLVPVRWLAVVLDEGQYIKNPSSQTAQVARALRASHRLVLSGTPIENRLMDLWSIMSFAMPGVLSSRAQFARLYDGKGDPFARKRLAARVRPFLLRRTKTQVAKDLPDRIEEDLFCEIEGEQKALYRAELKAAQQLLLRISSQKELAEQQFNFLTSLLRLRQICCHPRLLQPDSTAASAKTESLLEQLEPLMEEGQKVLVFSQFVQMLDLLRPALEQRNWPVFYLAGHTENRGRLVDDFQKAQGAGIFLISLKAGGFGLNLTAASYVILFDPWWNPAVENQAIDRTHRIGQVNKVIAYRLLIKDSIEEKIRALQKQKKALVEDVFGEEKFAQSLKLEDLQFLLA